MKKLFFLLLVILFSLSLFSCAGEEYEPVESTSEEARVVFTLSYGGKKYEVKYELYRMLFLSNRKAIDGGDTDVWASAQSEEYIEKINEVIRGHAADIFAAIHEAKHTAGYDVYSAEADEAVYEYVKISVEGNGADVKGHGSYEAFLAALKERYMNYSVADLLFRYSLAQDALNEYYLGTTDEVLGNIAGDFKVEESDVSEYYWGEESARILHLYFDSSVKDESDMYRYRDGIRDLDDELEVALYIINTGSPVVPEELIDTATRSVSGIMVGKFAYDDLYYSEYTEAAFSTPAGEVSDVILTGGTRPGYYLIYRLEKSEEHFEDCYDDILYSYLTNEMGLRQTDVADRLNDSCEWSRTYSDIVHKDISMD